MAVTLRVGVEDCVFVKTLQTSDQQSGWNGNDVHTNVNQCSYVAGGLLDILQTANRIPIHMILEVIQDGSCVDLAGAAVKQSELKRGRHITCKAIH